MVAGFSIDRWHLGRSVSDAGCRGVLTSFRTDLFEDKHTFIYLYIVYSRQRWLSAWWGLAKQKPTFTEEGNATVKSICRKGCLLLYGVISESRRVVLSTAMYSQDYCISLRLNYRFPPFLVSWAAATAAASGNRVQHAIHFKIETAGT